jgi:hypothetical protein
MAEKLEFDLSVKNNQLDKALDSSAKKAISLENALETAIGVLGGGFAIKAFDSLVGGFNSLIAVGKEAIDAAASQEIATNNLNNALARQGNFSRQASRDLLDYASAIQQTTIFEDDAIIANTALLQSLTKLSTEGLKQGVSAAADFATVLGIDLETATRLVAKATEGNVEAFKRYGVEIKKGSSDAESFANTIRALNSQFGGAAAAQLNTYSGSLKALNNAYGDLLEPIGDIIVKNPIVIALFNEIKNSINKANSEVTGLVPSLQELVKDGFIAASVASQILLDALGGITAIVQVLAGTFQSLSGLIGQTLVAPFELVIDSVIFLGSKIPVLGSAFEGLVNPLEGATEAMAKLADEGVNKIATVAEGNIFTDLSSDLDNFTGKVLDGSAAVSAAAAADIKNNTDKKNNALETNAEILKARRILDADILSLQAQSAAEQASFEAQLAALNLESTVAADQAKIDAIYTQKLVEAQAVYEGELLKNKSITNAKTLDLADDKAFETLKLASIKAGAQKELEEKNKLNDAKKKSDEDYKANLGSTLDQISTLQTSGNKTLIAVGKVAALSQIAISGPVAVAKAFELGPIIGPIAATAVAASIAAQAAKVAGVQFEQGGIVGQQGASAGADNRVATIRDGEMILNASQQKNLMDMINSGGGSSSPIIIQIDGREIAVAVRNQIQGGFRLA